MLIKKISIFLVICFLAVPGFAGKKFKENPRHTTNKNITAQRWVLKNRENDAFVAGRHGSTAGITHRQLLTLFAAYLLVSNYVEGASTASFVASPSNAQFNKAGNALADTAKDIFWDGVGLSQALPTELIKATTQALQNIVCPDTNTGCVLIEGSSVVCRGTEEEVNACEEKINNPNVIRKEVTPVTRKHAKTQGFSGYHLPDLDALLSCLGIPSDLFANLGIVSLNANGITLKYDGSFNIRTADNFLQTLIEESPFFKYIVEHNPTIITVSKNEVSLQFDVFSQYCARIVPERFYIDNRHEWEVRLPLHRVLEKLVMSVSGSVGLQKAGNTDTFYVATLKSEMGENGPPQILVKVYLDQSGSMRGERIDTLNSLMPALLSKLHAAAKKGQKFDVEIVTINEDAHLHASMILSTDQAPPPWRPITAFGGTNLIPIGEGLEITRLDIPQAVLAFTDGEHNFGDLRDHFEELRSLQQSGKFSQPTICAMGMPGDNSYFDAIENLFQGAVHYSDTVDGCMDHFLNSVGAITNPPTAIVISAEDGVTVSWPLNQGGLQPNSVRTVKDGDTITFGSFSEVVDTGTKPQEETKEEKRARLLRELSEL